MGLAVVLVVVAAAPAEAVRAKTVRVFAVGPKLDVAWLDRRESYRGKWFALFDRSLRAGSGAPLVQRGADDAASHLLGPSDPGDPVRSARDLVVLPEYSGFWSMLVGSRGGQARAIPPAPNSSAAAVSSLLSSYAPVVQYYAAKYPHLMGRAPQARLLVVSLTDTFVRVAVETFSELAQRYRAYVVAPMIMARDWQVVCEDKEAFNSADPPRLPGGVRCVEQDPVKVSVLRDPDEPDRDYAYEATSPDPGGVALIFDPAGRLISKQVKSYLLPIELPGVGLDLRPGDVSGLDAVETPVGRIGVLLSKDAWMPDLVAKLDQRRVDVAVQPEYFVGDVVGPGVPWAPDTMLASGYSALLRAPSFEAMVVPNMKGNIFDQFSDSQSHIAVRVRSRGVPGPALVGQPAQRGFARVERWVVPDPIRPDEPIAERRRRLAEAGRKLPASSDSPCEDPAVAGPCRGGQVEDVVWADVRVDRAPVFRRDTRRRARTAFSRNRPLASSRRAQRHVALAASGRRVVAAFEQATRDGSTISVVSSRDGGRTFSRRPAHPDRAGGGARNAWWPSVAVSGKRVFVAWTDDRTGVQRAYVAVSRDGGRRFGPPVAVDPATGRPGGAAAKSLQWRPVLAAAPGGGAYVAYLDEKERSADDGLPQAHVFFTRLAPDAQPGASVRIDGGEVVASAAKLDHSWAPAIASSGDRVTVSWVDFRTYDWRPYARSSVDGGASFGEERPLGTAPAAEEQLADAPAVALAGRRTFITWVDWRKRPETASKPSTGYDTWLATSTGGDFGKEVRADSLGDRQASSFAPALVADGEDALVAWQDSSTATGDIRISRIQGGKRRGRAVRVDDSGRSAINQYRPAAARSGRNVIVAWEDERDGPMQIYAAWVRASRIR